MAEIKRTLYKARYYNANGFAVAIVASVTNPIDWAAYIGATDGVETSEEDTLSFIAKRGCKLAEEDARHFFPNIELPYRP